MKEKKSKNCDVGIRELNRKEICNGGSASVCDPTKINFTLTPFIIWVFFILIIGGYTVFRWDYYLSNYIFEEICNDKKKIGLFIYEQVVLGDEYFMPFPPNKEPRDLDRRFIIGDNLIINKERFEKDYIFDVYKSIPLSEIGPITSIETSVIRKSDNKILSKAVSVANHRGWWSKVLAFGQISTDTCPSGRDDKFVSEFYKDHDQIILKTFIKNR